METRTEEQTQHREQRGEPREQLPENEIRVSFKTDVLRAVERAAAAFNTFDHVKFSAINSGISKLILIVEITKIKVEGLHQLNRLETLTKDRAGEGEEQRQGFLTAFKVELHKAKPTSVPTGYFYQTPYTHEHVEAVRSVKIEDREEGEQRFSRGGRGFGRGGRGRGFGRGGRGRGGFTGEVTEEGFEGRGGRGFRGERGGRGRGFGRGGRGGENFRGGDNYRGRDNFRGEGEQVFRGGERPRGGDFRGEGESFRGGDNYRGRGTYRGRDNRVEGENFRGEERPRGAYRGRGGERGARGGERGSRGGFTQAQVQTAPVQTRSTIPGLSGPRTNPPAKK